MTVAVPPSVAVYVAAPKLTFTSGVSSSRMATRVRGLPPSDTPAGSVPSSILTDFPPFTSSLSTAVKVKVCSVSPLSNVTLAGTPAVVGVGRPAVVGLFSAVSPPPAPGTADSDTLITTSFSCLSSVSGSSASSTR